MIEKAKRKNPSLFVQYFLLLERPLFAFAFSFLAYFILSNLGGSPFRVRIFAHFNYLADAFLHGQLHLRLLPPALHDLSFFKGKFYLYWPPFPAVVLTPFVALFGVGFSDVFFNVVVGSINVGVVAALLRAIDDEQLIKVDVQYRALLVLFFALGTVHVILALFGTVWFTAELLGFLFVGLAYLSALKLRGTTAFIAVGIFMSFAMLTRNHLLFTGIWPAYYLLSKNWNDRPKLYFKAALGLLPLLIMGILFLGYNFARFGSPFELGIRYQMMAPFFIADYHKYGAFSLHYLPTNFYYQYIFYPLPATTETKMGGSLFLLSPVFLYAFLGIFKEYRNTNVWMLVFSVIITSIPILLVIGTGWVQYGPRYTLDFTIPLLLLTALGVKATSNRRLLIGLTAISIAQYITGVIFFARLQL